MNIEWFNKEQKDSAVTLYYNNITLSKYATSLFENAYGILAGINKDTGDLILKKVMQEDIENKTYSKEDIYLLTIKPTYGRINSRQLINNICRYYDLDFTNKTSFKFNAKWNNGNNMLIINIKEGK